MLPVLTSPRQASFPCVTLGGGVRSVVCFILLLLFSLQFHLDFSAEVFSFSDLLIRLLEALRFGRLCHPAEFLGLHACHSGAGSSLLRWLSQHPGPLPTAQHVPPSTPGVKSKLSQALQNVPWGRWPWLRTWREVCAEVSESTCVAGSRFLIQSPRVTARACGHTVQ